MTNETDGEMVKLVDPYGYELEATVKPKIATAVLRR